MAQSFMIPWEKPVPMMEVIPSPPKKKKAPMMMTGANILMANRKPSVTYPVTFSRESFPKPRKAPRHMRIRAVPDTMLVASPPFRSNTSIRTITPTNAAGVRMAMSRAIFPPLGVSRSPVWMVRRSPRPSISSRFNRYALHTVTMPMTQNTGQAWWRIPVVVMPAAPAETAGAPWMTKS